MDAQTSLRQGIALVLNFQLPEHNLHISTDYITQYHGIVAQIEEGINKSLTSFRIQDVEMKRETEERAISYGEWPDSSTEYQTVYTDNLYCERTMF